MRKDAISVRAAAGANVTDECERELKGRKESQCLGELSVGFSRFGRAISAKCRGRAGLLHPSDSKVGET